MPQSESDPFSRASYTFSVVALITGTLLLPFDFRLALLPVSFACGWPQVGSL